MGRRATGTLFVIDGVYHARITEKVDGKTTRPSYCLNTSDEVEARKKTAALVRRANPVRQADGTRTFEPFAMEWLEERVRRGVAMVDSERGWLANFLLPTLGPLTLPEIRPRDIRKVLDAAVKAGKARQTIVHIRATLKRILDRAYQDELLDENPVDRVPVPSVRRTKKRRATLTDDEMRQYLSSDACDAELQLMSFVARAVGGMRTIDLSVWDYEMIDREQFVWCFVPRTKTEEPQRLKIPEPLRPRLRRRWEEAGHPSSGPVFPVRKGKRKGEFKKRRGVSYAKALRRDLARAGLTRRELFVETATTLPVDFHSRRREFSTALAEAGVNAQRARHLTAHGSEAMHQRYVMLTEAMQEIPPEVVASIVPK